MSKKSEYAARAEECARMAEGAEGAAKTVLMAREAQWLRLARGCFDTASGLARDAYRPSDTMLSFARARR